MKLIMPDARLLGGFGFVRFLLVWGMAIVMSSG